MKTDIGRFGKKVNGLTGEEVVELFDIEFGCEAKRYYPEFILWDLSNLSSKSPFDDEILLNRGRVEEFIVSILSTIG